MLLGVVGNPPSRSESAELQKLIARLNAALRSWEHRRDNDVRDSILAARAIAEGLLAQVQRKVHVNPARKDSLTVRRGGGKMSDHVQAIVYVHEEDGEFYVHGFGDAHLDLSVKQGTLCIEGLKDRTHVQMFAEPDGSVSIVGRDGQRLWEDFD